MYILVVLVTVGVFSQGLGQNTRNSSKIERFIYDRCRVYSTEASAYDQILQHLAQFSDYLSYTASLLPQGKEQFCKDERPRLITLMKDLTSELGICFPKQEKYLPRFIYHSFIEFMNFVCAERNMENFFSTQGAECRQALKSQQAGEEVGNCFRKFFARFNSYVEKDDLCLDLKLTKTCFGEALTRNCPNFAGYESLNTKFFHAIRKPCNDAIRFGASTAILIAAFIISKII